MHIAWNARFAEERERFALRHVCEDCALFDPEQSACAHEYPIEQHARAYYDDAPELIIFCKEFQLD